LTGLFANPETGSDGANPVQFPRRRPLAAAIDERRKISVESSSCGDWKQFDLLREKVRAGSDSREAAIEAAQDLATRTVSWRETGRC